ncbi:MAG: transglycosylase domain-containing protein [Burkholderiales bacterium]|nr:transglycosylase domain-containing protein [Burkholderiales bacterium]
MKRNVLYFIAVAFFLLGLTAAASISWLWRNTPTIQDLQKIRIAQPSVLLASDGKTLATFRRAWQKAVPLDDISPHVINALIATEDHRFYEHRGVDVRRTAAAIMHTLAGNDQGGSTITQQLARNLFPEKVGRSRSIERKLKEIVTAVKIERNYGKPQILETYLNTVPFLYNVYGIDMAARIYFDKSAAQLNLLESATLVGMLKGSSHYNPVTNPERALARRNVVLAQLVRRGSLTQDEFDRLRDEALGAGLFRQTEPPGIAPHFVAHVRKWLENWTAEHGMDLTADGLVIETTLDPQLQHTATQAVEKQAEKLQRIANAEWSRRATHRIRKEPDELFPAKASDSFRYFWDSQPELLDAFIRETAEFKKARAKWGTDSAALEKLRADAAFMKKLRADKTRLEAGFIAIDPVTSEIKAWVGSRNFQTDQYDHVAQAARQPGSTFKPFVYGAALEQGISPFRTYSGNPFNIRLKDGTRWRPTDMDGPSGPMTMREGLIHSRNVITAQVMLDVGVDSVMRLAQSMGIRQSRLDPVVSLALGTSPVTLLELASAYTTLANVGEYRPPIFVKRITDSKGNVLADFSNQPRQSVMSESTALELIDILRAVVNRGTGQAIRKQFGINADVAGKTGTTQNNTDGWFVMMHPNLVVGAWVGFNDQRVTMRSNYWGQGGHNAIRLVGDFFQRVVIAGDVDPIAQFPRPWRSTMMALYEQPEPDAQAQPPENENPPSSMPPPGSGVIVRSDGRKIYFGDARGIEEFMRKDERAGNVSADELSRALTRMGRDTVSGERIDNGAVSEGNSDDAGASSASGSGSSTLPAD